MSKLYEGEKLNKINELSSLIFEANKTGEYKKLQKYLQTHACHCYILNALRAIKK